MWAVLEAVYGGEAVAKFYKNQAFGRSKIFEILLQVLEEEVWLPIDRIVQHHDRAPL